MFISSTEFTMQTCCCACRNIAVVGEQIANDKELVISSIDAQILRRNSQDLLRLDHIEIANYAKATIRMHGETCNEIHCCRCASRIVVIVTKSGAFASLSLSKEPRRQVLQRSSAPTIARPMNLFIPFHLKKFIVSKGTQEHETSEFEKRWNDTKTEELEVMFQRFEEITVGSYANHSVDEVEL